jgi:SAM-dependent methyltransferase
MEKHEYETMHRVELEYWWYIGLHELVLSLAKKHVSSKGGQARILDAGCGTGAMSHKLAACGFRTFGFDLSADAISFCRQRHLTRQSQDSIVDLPFQTKAFDLIISLDVLCDLERVGVGPALKEIQRVLADGGVFVFNLPAYNWLKSSHDAAVNNLQRFSMRAFERQLKGAGLSVAWHSYRNTILFPALALVRILRKFSPETGENLKSDLKPLNPLVNGFLAGILRAENRILERGARFPFGLSLAGVARK